MNKNQLFSSLETEINICKRLYTKIPKDQMNYRPKEGMRSMLELLQYLTIIGVAMPSYWVEHSSKAFGEFFAERTNAVTQITEDTFLTAMENQVRQLADVFSKISDEDLNNMEITYPWGQKGLLGEGILNAGIKFITGYKSTVVSVLETV